MGRSPIVIVVVFCLAAPALGQWSTYQHDAERTGRSDASFDPRDLHYAWSAPNGFSRPIIAGNTVYASRVLNAIPAMVEYAAFNLNTGQQYWSNLVPWNSTGPAVLDGLFVALDGKQHLRVFDSDSGKLLTDTALSGVSGQGQTSPILLPGAIPGHIDCFLSGHDVIRKYDISATASLPVWSVAVGGGGPIALGGDSIFDTQPGFFVAVDRTSGETNSFFGRGLSGGSFRAPLFDSARHRFYGEEDSLTAWDYIDNQHINLLWEIKNGPRGFASAALGKDGDLYFVDLSGLLREYTPDGVLARSSTMQFLQGVTPVLQDGFIWIADLNNTYALDLQTLDPVMTLPSRTPYADADASAGILFEQGFVLGKAGTPNNGGFDVYIVPEPSSAMILIAGTCLGLIRRARCSNPISASAWARKERGHQRL